MISDFVPRQMKLGYFIQTASLDCRRTFFSIALSLGANSFVLKKKKIIITIP